MTQIKANAINDQERLTERSSVGPTSIGIVKSRTGPSSSLLLRAVKVSLIGVISALTMLYMVYRQSEPGPAEINPQAFAANQGPPDFDLRQSSIAVEEILRGGPPKDGIPAISNPKFIAAATADYLAPSDLVVGVAMNKSSRAYPLRILNYHEIVNDQMDAIPFAITYCPLCDSVCVFDRRTPLGEREFGVSGLLYNSNVLMYDRRGKPESLWSQIKTTGVTGPGMEKALKTLPVELTTWSDWKAGHPETEVLSQNTGHQRDYSVSPYGAYFTTPQLMFPVNHEDPRLPSKTRVIGLWSEDKFTAIPITSFSETNTEIHSTINGKTFSVVYSPGSKSMRVVDADPEVHWMYSFWFAWAAFHPESSIITTSNAEPVQQ